MLRLRFFSAFPRCLAAVAASLLLFAAGTTSAGNDYAGGPVYEVTSTGLLTLGKADRSMRVAVTYAEPDEAAVPVVVRFLNGRGQVLHRQRATLSDGQPVVAELNRRRLGINSEILVRVEVALALPVLRNVAYPIVVTAQPIAMGGFGRLALNWPGGVCGCSPLPGTSCGPLFGPGQHANCAPPDSIVSEF